jgi:hypothetical protein
MCHSDMSNADAYVPNAMSALGHVCGRRPGKNFLTACSIGRVRSRVRPVSAAGWPLALMLCAERVPIESPHLEVR